MRQLKLIRKFQKLQLLLHVLSTTMDALKLLLFLVCLIVLVFGCAFYVLEPDTMDSLATSVYLCTVTVTTVGTCDMNPVTPVGKTMAGALCLTSVSCLKRLSSFLTFCCHGFRFFCLGSVYGNASVSAGQRHVADLGRSTPHRFDQPDSPETEEPRLHGGAHAQTLWEV